MLILENVRWSADERRFATEDSLKEIHRVLRPGGALGLVWNIEDCEAGPVLHGDSCLLERADNAPKEWTCRSPWQQKMKDIINSLEDGHVRFRHMEWKQVFEQQLDSNPLQALKDTFTHHMPQFSLPIGEETIEWTTYLSDEAVWERYTTISYFQNLEASKLEELKQEVLGELKKEGVERNAAGEVALHGRTYMAWTSRV